MEIRVAKTAGFCFGVERAVKMVYDQIREASGPIYTYGPIIHNEEVVRDLESRGVRVLQEGTVPEENGATVIIRSLGVTNAVMDLLEQSGARVLDATCPFVKKIHRLVRQETDLGRQIVIVGNSSHPEVEGIVGWCPKGAVVVSNPEEAEKTVFPPGIPVSVVCQTTFTYKKFQDVIEIFLKKGYDINVLNTICNATSERQSEARQIAAQGDGMIVIGGKSSSNTQKLFEICKTECDNTIYIQTVKDLSDEWLSTVSRLGITAGASTPKNIIEEVQTYVRIKF